MVDRATSSVSLCMGWSILQTCVYTTSNMHVFMHLFSIHDVIGVDKNRITLLTCDIVTITIVVVSDLRNYWHKSVIFASL